MNQTIVYKKCNSEGGLTLWLKNTQVCVVRPSGIWGHLQA